MTPKQIKHQIEIFMTHGVSKLELPMMPISDYEAILTSLGYTRKELEGIETNGWQIDFWYYFTHKTAIELCLAGSLWYGNFNITKAEEE